MAGKEFTYKHTVYLNETNAMGGVVYFANYVKWQGMVREEFFMKAFPAWKEVMKLVMSGSANMITVEEHSRFRRHASFGDTVIIKLKTANLKKCSFDLIFNMEVVEHVGDLPTFMQACLAQLKPGGITFVSTINRTPLSYLFAILGAEYVLKLLPKGTHHWRKFVTPLKLETLLNAGGVDCFWRTGIRVNPWRRSFALQKSMAVSYMLAGKKQSLLAV